MNKYSCTPPITLNRRLGFGSLMIAVVTAIIVAFVALSVTHINQAAYSGLTGNKLALQAQEYALTKAEFVRAVNYDDLTAQSRTLIPNTDGFYDEIVIGAEEVFPDDNSIKQRICTVNVYKDVEALPRYSLRVTRLSASQGGTGVPTGTVLPWYGQVADIPSGFVLCNGSNGTPDLRDRFIVGAGSTYALGATGGANTVALTASQLPSHYHAVGQMQSNNAGRFLIINGWSYALTCKMPTGGQAAGWNGSGGGHGYSGVSTYTYNQITSLPVEDTGSNVDTSHENRPPYYALYYIMKL